MIPAGAGMPMRKRRCPRCGHIQTVALTLLYHSVTCRRCGALIPAAEKPVVPARKNK
jgi:transcription elongation factor Elf1